MDTVKLEALAAMLGRLLILLQIRGLLTDAEVRDIVHGNGGTIDANGLTNAIAAKLRA